MLETPKGNMAMSLLLITPRDADGASLGNEWQGIDLRLPTVPPAGHAKVLHKFNLRIWVLG